MDKEQLSMWRHLAPNRILMYLGAAFMFFGIGGELYGMHATEADRSFYAGVIMMVAGVGMNIYRATKTGETDGE